MSVVIFQTKHAIFNFDQRDLPHQLNFLAIDYDSEEKTELLKLITTTKNEKILIPENHIWFEFMRCPNPSARLLTQKFERKSHECCYFSNRTCHI